MITLENRNYERAKAKSVLVSLSNQNQEITGFLRDISEGGLKIQRISAGSQVDTGNYDCHFVLPDLGRIDTKVAVLGTGDGQEKFGALLLRMRFENIDPESQEKIRFYVMQSQSS